MTVEEVTWDYSTGSVIRKTPSGDPLNAPKTIFRRYQDAAFTQPITSDPRLGWLGPMIRAEVGETIVIHLNNRASHSQKWTLEAPFGPLTDQLMVPNNTTIVHIKVPLDALKTSGQPLGDRSAPYLYSTNTSAEGLLLVYDKGILDELHHPHSAFFDQEMPVVFGNRDRFNINGFAHNVSPQLTFERTMRIRWYLMSTVSKPYNDRVYPDAHSAHWHGNTVLWKGHRVDVVDLLPKVGQVADMQPDNLGSWLFHCHVSEHMQGGMSIKYEVTEGWAWQEGDEGDENAEGG
ncbi:hypothetical protein BZG36_04029 [Bifiguratus adelaidae]|uniref:Plastocyanin-like domain-containing protein n=1 Tax=Bifiguratus adelaidae TaxID=1938954 RepID=A0A261XYQ9_9FUNG|nr:hypothetical protein BZG36_04029 [Bifiguratus adelaidae]